MIRHGRPSLVLDALAPPRAQARRQKGNRHLPANHSRPASQLHDIWGGGSTGLMLSRARIRTVTEQQEATSHTGAKRQAPELRTVEVRSHDRSYGALTLALRECVVQTERNGAGVSEP
ncbi:hypothetical protein K505DRAFT_57089 [Melanomma pulvis-pyrius CBS 109.77]|uniref:Uncharacterized protein n=1 Tax=Melanomma pulvis-pyrius CBS 109.77 TaxID=1314802 RepID=A0A6A6X804_9PLEO|nr:hypothetical protein K505DRAFT_57089 [Melanomma pulvis-pyrius CBS 109.77]